MKNILVIQLSRLGDLVQTLPLIKALKQDITECRVTLFCVREFAPILKSAPFIDRVASLPFSEVRTALAPDDRMEPTALEPILQLPELQEEYDRVINLTHTLGSAYISSRVSARAVYGRIDTYPGEVRVAGDWGKYLFSVTEDRALSMFNLVDVYMGMGGIAPRPVTGYLAADETQKETALKLLDANGYRGEGRLIGIHMGANKAHRTWGVERFAELGNGISDAGEDEIVLIGSSQEADMGEEYLASTGGGVINLIGRTDLYSLPGVLSLCDLLVTNDTGPAHIAAGVGTKVVGIFFSTAFFGETAPYGEGHVILQTERKCAPCKAQDMCAEVACREDIPVEAVKAVLLGKHASVSIGGIGVYTSRFHDNGTLIYEPLASSGRGPYQEALLSRMMWGAALGLENGQAPGYENPEINTRAKDWLKRLSALKGIYRKGGEAALGILGAFSRRPINQRKIMSLAGEIEKTEEKIRSLDNGLGPLRAFHQHHIMDMDRVNYPELARLFASKYSRMLGVTENFRETLGRVLQEEESGNV
ncbi:MAG: glycosyltransferase family 9 protein [Desulfobacteraceae bacterium]